MDNLQSAEPIEIFLKRSPGPYNLTTYEPECGCSEGGTEIDEYFCVSIYNIFSRFPTFDSFEGKILLFICDIMDL